MFVILLLIVYLLLMLRERIERRNILYRVLFVIKIT